MDVEGRHLWVRIREVRPLSIIPPPKKKQKPTKTNKQNKQQKNKEHELLKASISTHIFNILCNCRKKEDEGYNIK